MVDRFQGHFLLLVLSVRIYRSGGTKKAAGSQLTHGLLNKKAMGALPCPPMALDVHLYTGLSLQPKGGPLKKETAKE